MPKLYEYFGLIVMFYANEHEPVHVHGKWAMIILSARRTWITLRKLRSIQATPVLAQTMIMAGKCQGRESKAEIIVLDGIVTGIRYSGVAGRAPLEFREMQYFQELVSTRADDIVRKWIDFFVLHKSIRPERITGRLK